MKFSVQVPANFDADKYVSNYRGKSLPQVRDGLYLFVSYLTDLGMNKKEKEHFIETGFVSLHSSYLKKNIGDNYTRVRDILVSNGVVESNESWITGKTSTGYRLTSEYMGETREVVIRSLQIQLNVDSDLKKEQKNKVRLQKELTYLTKWLDKRHLTIDEVGAFNFIEHYRALMLKKLREYKGRYPSKVERRVFGVLHSMNTDVRTFSDRLQDYKRDERGRFYPRPASIKKHLRYFLNAKGEQMIALDLKSSQPYLLLILLKRGFWERLKNKKTSKHFFKPPIQTSRNIIMFLDSLKNHTGKEFEGFRLLNINWTEDFYQWVADQIPLHTADRKIRRLYGSRDAVKTPILITLYSEEGDRTEVYQHIFPDLMKQILPLETLLLEKIKSGDKSIAPLLLQSIEAELFIDTICKQFSELAEDAPIYSIHDSILVRVSDKEQARKLMVSILTDATGREPGIVEDLLDPALLDLEKVVNKDWKKITNPFKLRMFKDDTYLTTSEKDKLDPPLLRKIPVWNGRKIISIRYVDANEWRTGS